MEELKQEAKKLEIIVTEEVTEEELTKLIEDKKKEIEQQKVIEKENIKSKKKTKKNNIKVIDNSNKPINEKIEKETVSSLGLNTTTVHGKELKQASNGEFYEELANGIGMWSRTGETFLLKELDK